MNRVDADQSNRVLIEAAGYAFVSQVLLCRASYPTEAKFQASKLQEIASLFELELDKLQVYENTHMEKHFEIGRGIGRALRMICPLAAGTLKRDKRGWKKRLPTKKRALHCSCVVRDIFAVVVC